VFVAGALPAVANQPPEPGQALALADDATDSGRILLIPRSIVVRVTFLAKLRLGNGTLKPKVRAALESEGLVLIEEGLGGSVRYERFRAPGRRHHGKVTGERIGVAVSEERFVVYCRSGSAKLIDTAFSNPRLSMLDISLQGDDTVAIRIDYDRADLPKFSGEITILARTPNAANIVDQLRARLGGAEAR
jgi:hypothetical protein